MTLTCALIYRFFFFLIPMCEIKVNKILDWLDFKLEAKQSCIILFDFFGVKGLKTEKK